MSGIRRKNIIWKIEKCLKQLALIVEKNAKYHSNLQKVNQLDAKNVLERTNPKEILEVETAEIEDSAVIIVDSETTDQEKCTKQFALTAEKNAKYHSSQVATSQLGVENVFKHLEIRF